MSYFAKENILELVFYIADYSSDYPHNPKKLI